MSKARFLTRPAPPERPRTADVVIIGGGPAGTAALWALGRADPSLRLVLVEQAESLGAGSSGASLEQYRTCWPTPCLARQMTRSISVFHAVDEYLGAGAAEALALKQRGYLYCGFTQRQTDALAADVAHLHQHGLTHVEFLGADEVAYRYPWLAGRVAGAKYDPRAGWLDSAALVYHYARSAANATILLGETGAAIRVEGGRVRGITSPLGDIDAPQVVIAAGAGARAVGRTAGIELPVVLRPRQSFTTPWRHDTFPEDSPVIIGGAPFPHGRPEARTGAIFAWEYGWNSKNAPGVDGPARDYLVEPAWPVEALRDPRFPSIVLLLLARQFGDAPGEGFDDPRYLRGISHNIGYYVYRSPDNAYQTLADGSRGSYHSQRAIIGPWPGIEGLSLSVAHVGHGIMASAASGEIIAATVLGRDLPDPVYADFGVDVPWVPFDAGGLGGD